MATRTGSARRGRQKGEIIFIGFLGGSRRRPLASVSRCSSLDATGQQETAEGRWWGGGADGRSGGADGGRGKVDGWRKANRKWKTTGN